MLEREVKAD